MICYTLNLIDLLFTLHALKHGGVELNPLMQCIPIMIIYKTAIVGAPCWWLSKHSRRGLMLCAVVYGVIDLWHLINILGVAL